MYRERTMLLLINDVWPLPHDLLVDGDGGKERSCRLLNQEMLGRPIRSRWCKPSQTRTAGHLKTPAATRSSSWSEEDAPSTVPFFPGCGLSKYFIWRAFLS